MSLCPACGQEIVVAGVRWQIELPMTKPLTLNHRMHHMVKAKKVREIRDAAGELIRLACVPELRHVRTTVVYSPRDARVRDPINLIPTLKACEDALKDCGVVEDDNPLYVTSLMPVIVEKNEDKRGFLWFVVEEG